MPDRTRSNAFVLIRLRSYILGRFQDISDDYFVSVVNRNNCIRDVVGELGYSRSSGSMGVKVSERIKRLNIDISHFHDRKSDASSHPKYSLKEILIKDSPYENINRLKIRIIKEGLLEYKCSKCGNTGIWNGKKLTLQLEHKNGIHNDHRLSNLEFLCPNCHSQTDTYSGKNIGKYCN